MKNNKKLSIVGLVILSLILCAYLVFSTTGISGSGAYPTGADGIRYVTTGTSVNHTALITFDHWTNETNLSFTDWRVTLTDIANLTFWTDINGTWAAISYNESTVNANGTYGFAYASYLPANEGEVKWNVKVANLTGKSEWLFSANKSYTFDFVQVRDIDISPVDGTIFTSSTPTVNITVIGTESSYYCCLIMNQSQKDSCKYASNNTLTTFSGATTDWGLITGKSYSTYVNCTKVTSSIINQTTAITYKYSASAPTVTLISPANNYWSNTALVAINVSPLDLLIVNCSLYGNFNGSWGINQTDPSIVSEQGTNWTSVRLRDNSTGYTWGYRCSNEAGQVASANYTLYVDTVAPDKISCVSPVAFTRATDYTPTLGWSTTTDTTFARYTLFLMNGSSGYIYSYNITSNSTSTFAITNNLTADMQWYWNVSITDQAGNSNVSDNCTVPREYYPDSVGHTLRAGYNFFSIVRNTDTVKVSGSELCNEPSVTPTSVSKWNITNNGWITYVCGTSTNNFTVVKSDPVVFNMPYAAVWETRRVWDLGNSTTIYTNITNASGVNWNLIGITNDTTMTDIDNGNRNITTLKGFEVANETSSTTIWSNVPYTLSNRYIAYNSLLVYNETVLLASGNYSVNWNKGTFILLGGQPADANWSGHNLTFDYSINDVHMLNWMSYPNQSQVNVPFKVNWTLNGVATIYDGSALWVNLNDTQQTTLRLDRSLW